jgi:type III secretion system YscQ/HrcQ family protein
MAVRPFPYASLPKLTRRQYQLMTALRACWEQGGSERAARALRGLLGRELRLALGQPHSISAPELAARCAVTAGVAVLVEQALPARPITCWVELAPHTAHQLVDLTLGGDANVQPTPSISALDDLSRGALAYLVARQLAALGDGWTLRHIVELTQLPAAELEDCVVWPISLTLEPVTLSVRAYVPERLSLQHVPERPVLHDLSHLGVTLVASAGSAQLPLATLRELAQGDVVVLDQSGLVRESSAWRGDVLASLPGSRCQLRCSIEEQGLRVADNACAEEHAMSTGHVHKAGETGAPAGSVPTDAAIELQVELARFSLSLGELQRLQVGDVLVTGRRIGERVSVRVSGQAFAEAELVDVDGEVGVRLTSFSEPR